MKVLALDVSTKTGWAVFEEGKLVRHGLIQNPQKIQEYGTYPWNYLYATEAMTQRLLELADNEKPDVIVVEETNGSRARYTQKVLEFLHCNLLIRLSTYFNGKVFYVNSSEWCKTIGMAMSKEDKKANHKLNVEKSLAASAGRKMDKAKLGIKGKITKKHLSVRWVNENYNLDFKIKDNDIADAICLGSAYIKGCSVCDGK
jgi:hypothetical protein